VLGWAFKLKQLQLLAAALGFKGRKVKVKVTGCRIVTWRKIRKKEII
jgi:hypothetical protein